MHCRWNENGSDQGGIDRDGNRNAKSQRFDKDETRKGKSTGHNDDQ